jgi:chromosome segregation ATPase
MSSTKRILVVCAAWPPLMALGTVLLSVGQVAAQAPSQALDVHEARDGPMRLSEESRAIDGQQNLERLPPGFHAPLHAADELAAALARANEMFEALTGATKTAATELYWRLEATRQQRDRLAAALVDVQGKLRVREGREKELAERVAALGEEATQSEADTARLRLELEASEQRRQQLEGLGEELVQLKDELLGLRRLLKAANVALAQTKEERDAARRETAALRAEVSALLNTALASLHQEDRPPDSPPNAGLAPSGNLVKAPLASSPAAQDGEAGL